MQISATPEQISLITLKASSKYHFLLSLLYCSLYFVSLKTYMQILLNLFILAQDLNPIKGSLKPLLNTSFCMQTILYPGQILHHLPLIIITFDHESHFNFLCFL